MWGLQGSCHLKAGTIITPTEPSAPAAATISRMVVSNCFFTSASSESIKPSKPAQMAETFMSRPLSAFCISSTLPASPRPPGSKPTMPRFSMKSSFSLRFSPGAMPSWNDRLSTPFFLSLFLALAHELRVSDGATASVAIPASERCKNCFLFILRMI